MDFYEDIKQAYIACMLWSSGEGEFDNKTIEDFAPETIYKIDMDIHRFMLENGSKIKDIDKEQVGHDLWLTRNHHGAGFWDRPELYGQALADELTTFSHGMGEQDLYLGDNGLMYLM